MKGGFSLNQNQKRRSSLTVSELLLFLAGILFCLVLITSAMMSGLFARYRTSDTGSDSARVAQFGDLTLVETGDFGSGGNGAGMLIPGVNLQKDAKVSFTGSEMTTFVFVEISAPGWSMTDGRHFSAAEGKLSWSVMETWTLLADSNYVYYLTLEPNTVLDGAQVIAPLANSDDQIRVSDAITEEDMAALKKENLTITLQASVIQAGGFASAKDAWEYLNR